jgi:hypothetical protein
VDTQALIWDDKVILSRGNPRLEGKLSKKGQMYDGGVRSCAAALEKVRQASQLWVIYSAAEYMSALRVCQVD